MYIYIYIYSLGQDESRRKRKLLLSFIPGLRAIKAEVTSSHSYLRVSTSGQHCQVRVCSSVWSFDAVFTNLRNTWRHPRHVGASMLENKKKVHIPLILTEIPIEQIFICIPDKPLNKNKKFWYSSKEAKKKKSITHLGGAFHQYHMRISVFSCEAGNGVLFFYCSTDRRRLGFCVRLTVT